MKILASASPGEVRVVAWDGTDCSDVAIWRPGRPDGVGDIHRGRVSKLAPAMAGAFVALDGADGFLPDSEGGKRLSEGDAIAVRITRAAQSGKGPRLARIDRDCGAGPPVLLERGPDAVSRLAALHPTAAIIVDDPALAALLRPGLGARLTIGPGFDDAVEAAFAGLLDPIATLPGGAQMHVHTSPALTAIDIDLAGATASRQTKAASQQADNRALLPALARQIRLRNLSGAILVDLAGMPARRRAALAPDFTAALADDPQRPRFLGFTALGLAEIVRTRTHPPLGELMAGPHAAGLTALRDAAAAMRAHPERPLILHATQAIIAALRADPVALDDFARRAGRPLGLHAISAAPAPSWSVEEARHG